MRIVEIFESIQGEGDYQGTPALFIRLQGCNLRCKWCDTKYARWSQNFKHMTVEEVVERIKEYKGEFVVFTGGEPLLQMEEVLKVCSSLFEYDPYSYLFMLETNGTLLPKPGTEELNDLLEGFDYICISPKDLKTAKKVSKQVKIWRERYGFYHVQIKVIPVQRIKSLMITFSKKLDAEILKEIFKE